MQLEQQVCNLELAKKLQELGVKQESLFWWQYQKEDGWTLHYGMHLMDKTRLSAFTVAELGELLPKNVQYSHKQITADVMQNRGDWFWMTDIYLGPDKGHYTDSANTEADARAKMLIYLIENKLITI